LTFYPQSIVVQQDQIILLNRFEPALGFYSLTAKDKNLDFLRLQHAADKKFSARFFTDLTIKNNTLFAMETSTATLRKMTLDGKITDVLIPSTTQGQIIDKFLPLTESSFLFLDTGTKRVLVRDEANMKVDEPDQTGKTLACAGNDILYCPSGILVLTTKDNTQTLQLQSLQSKEKPQQIAQWENANIQLLDVDDQGVLYLYGKDEKGSFIESIDVGVTPNKRVRTKCTELIFASQATRIAKFEKANSFILLLEEGESVVIARLKL
jgi:hypothetical protein